MQSDILYSRSVERRPQEGSSLDADEIHLWRASLDPPGELVAALRRVLSPDERERVRRLRSSRNRRRVAVSRGLLRRLLAGYAGVAAHELRFSYGPWGKPALAPLPRGMDLRFNVAHSAELIVVAITRARPVGVDVERIRPLRNLERLARRHLSSREWAAFRRVPEARRTEAFFDFWTREEAFCKAMGRGLPLRPQRIEMARVSGRPASVPAVDAAAEEASAWCLRHFEPAPGYVGALAVRGRRGRVVWRDLESAIITRGAGQ
jgi:4'-phosphopantetheinyl transferase